MIVTSAALAKRQMLAHAIAPNLTQEVGPRVGPKIH